MVPFISVIIPTYEREAILCESIASVLEQDYPHFEILVVDQTRQHHLDTEAYLQEMDAIGKIRWLRVCWASLPGARNYGVRQSNGEIILFLDDDVQLPPGFLAAHARNYDRPEVGAVAGRIFDRMKLADAQPGLTIEDLPPEAMDPGIAWYHLDLVHTIKPQQVLTARGCNMSFRKTLFTQHGIWFDERFRGSAVREESDFCLHIRRTGLIIWYDPDAHLVHLGEENGGCHDISTRSLQYQVSFYHNHFLMLLKNLTFWQGCRLSARLFDCHVLGHPPCCKSTSPLKVLTRALFYTIGFLAALLTHLSGLWNSGQTHTHHDKPKSSPRPPAPQRVLILSHTYIVPLNCEKLRSLSQLEPDIEVVVVVPKRWQPGGVQKGTIESQGWEDGSFRVVPVANWSQNHQGLLCFGLELVTLLRQFRPQVIQVEQGSRSIAYAQLIVLNKLLGLKAKLLFFTWWNLPYQLKPPVSWLEQFNLRHSHGIIVGNQDGAEILRQHGYKSKIQVMPQLGVDEALFSPKPQNELASRLGIQSQDFVVGYVGRFVPEKGLLTLCDALGGIHPEFNWKWLLVGRGDLKTAIQEKAQTLGINDRLIWVESVPHAEIPNYLNLMHTLVLPSETSQDFKTLTSVGWKEQFGHVLIEAMACRVPVIGSDSGEIPFVIGDAGLTFPEGNAEILRDRLTQLMAQPDLARSLAQKGYDRAMLQYTNRALAKQQLEFYRQLN
ncbi:hormogonium polysaccharide biosynthesis glycosyltransferase HpsO [Leptolyngbya ohadii]|uniref:hormogonium polysaccharide biosynthesis glycosyltransferase HpsO n=1 Tax=Leptolyngbya ohadii TaxID=1962290 RepID=UPI0021F10956|nr:hormogonium polysaccharide biosynthesis glycosyltransferase HpsO [Leptolyngbya ohadii]